MRARDLTVSVVDEGSGTLYICCTAFKLKGSLKRNQFGAIDAAARRAKEKQIEGLIGFIDFPEETNE